MGSFAWVQLQAPSDGLRLSGPALPTPGGNSVDVMDLLHLWVLC